MRLSTLRHELSNLSAVEACARRFGLIGDPTRLKICYLLCRHPKLSVSELAQILETSVSVVSHSLGKLRRLGLVRRRQEAKEAFYTLEDKRMAQLVQVGLSSTGRVKLS